MSTVTTPSGGKRPTSGSTDVPTRDKRLKTIACDRCRRRKVKCDGDGYNHTPCKYCVSVNLECTYGQKTGRTSTASKNNSTSSRQTSRSKSSSVATNNDNVTTSSGTSSASRQRKSIISNQNSKQNTKKPSQNSSTYNLPTNGNRPSRIVPQALPTPDTKKNDLEYIVKLVTTTTMQNENQVRQQLKHVQITQIEESSPSLSQTSQTSHALLEDSHLTGQLVDLYFKNFHPLLPVLHKAYFMGTFHDKSKSMSRLLLCAVCAIGSSYTNNPTTRKDGNNPHTVGLAYYECAQEMVNHYFDLPRLSTATALFLLGIFDALRSLKSRIYVGMATTLAITMRLHDKNAFPDTLSVNEREARKRLWWGISIANHLQCITLNRMLALQDNHCSIEYPDKNCDDDDTECKIVEYFKHYLMIIKIIYDVLEFNLSENYESDIMMNNLEEKLDSWKDQLPPFLNIEEAKELDISYNETTIEHLRIYLCILYNYAIIRIHHPNISSSRSLAACTRAANRITSFINQHFVNMINSKQFIVHCALYAGFIHIKNLKDPQHSKDSKRNIAETIKLFQNVLKIPSLHYINYGIKNFIAIFASQLEGIPDVENDIMDVVKSALILVSGNVGNPSSSNESPVSPVTQLPEDSRNINNNNNNNVSNIAQDNSPMSFPTMNLGLKKFNPIQQSAQNSPPGINLPAHTTATRPHYIPLSPISHRPTGLQTQQMNQSPGHQQHQTTQSIFTTSPTPLDPPVTSAKIDSTNSSLMSDINYSSAHYINQHSNQTRHDNNTSSTWPSNYNYQWTPQQSSHLQPIQTQSHQNVQQQSTMSPTGNETISMSPNSSSLPPLLITTTSTNPAFTSPQMQFPYQNALPSMTFPQFSASQQQQPQHSSQPRQYYLASNSTSPPSGNFVTGSDMSTGLAPMTGMIGNGGGVTNGILSTSENSVSMLIDNQESSMSQSGEIDAQQQHHHHHHQQQRRPSQPAQYYYS